MAEIIKAHKDYTETRKRNIANWNVPASVKDELWRFVEELGLGKVNRGRKISLNTQAKYLDMLKVPLQYLAKPTDRLTPKDIEAFERALSGDRIRRVLKGQPYAHGTKIEMRKALKVFLRWRLGQAEAHHLVEWLDTRKKEKTPDYLKETEVEQLLRGCRTAQQRYAVAVLFDSGARAEEFINIRYEDIQLPEGKESYVRLTLKEEYSKTKGRTISLYWRHSVTAVTDYLKKRLAQGLGPKDPVFQHLYPALRMFIGRLGHRVLKRRVHPHLFRHSSATYYATELNRQELCYRYGWRFSSNMPDVYISRSGMQHRELDQKFTATELSTVKDQLAQVQQSAKIKDDRIAILEKTVTDLQSNFAQISEVLGMKPSIADVEAAIARKTQASPRDRPT